jgi:CDGSH-type Zn-finger protein
MSREETHDETGPALFDEDDVEGRDGTIAVCRCGLSENEPFCDGRRERRRRLRNCEENAPGSVERNEGLS